MKTKMTMLALAAVAACALEAKVQFGVPFADHVVLQRDRALPVWGTADAGEKVKVCFAGQTVETTAAADGSWSVQLAPLATSCEGHTLTANDAAVNDVLVGEVWYCCGQSNAELPLCGDNPHFRDGKGLLRARMTNKPFVRFCYQSNYRTSVEPKKVPAKPVEWKTFTADNLLKGSSFSAMGFYFALEIHNALGIPVGIVGSYFGGTRAEAWTPKSGLESVPSCRAYAEQKLLNEEEFRKGRENKTVKFGGLQDQPRVLWNEMVAPWVPFAIKGFIWYQGCSNADDGLAYADKMHALYNGWAKEFRNPDLKLYFVQLAPWGYDKIATIQEAQAIFAAAEKNAGMAVINDRGNLDDIHPNDKETVGMRLAALALSRDYGFDDLCAESPTVKDWKVEGDTFVLTFNHANRLYVYNPNWSSIDVGFEIAGPDGVFKPARITTLVPFFGSKERSHGAIDGDGLRVRAEGVTEPKKLRYLHSRPWFGCLYGETGLPVGAFHIGD